MLSSYGFGALGDSKTSAEQIALSMARLQAA